MRRDLGLLILRVGVGVPMIYGHGWGKAMSILQGDFSFADPIGLGPAASLILAGFAEAICSVLLILGVSVRWAAIQNLGRLSRSEALIKIREAVNDPHPHVRRAAQKTLDQLDKRTQR